MIKDPFIISLVKVCTLFQEIGIPFHVTGGLVTSHYGDPRFTQDIDLVVKILPGTKKKLLELLEEKGFYFSEEAISEAIDSNRIFQIIDEETVLKIDCHVGESIPDELSRSIETELFPKIIVPIASKEDAIISKLLWVKKGSNKSRDDLKGMLLNPIPYDIERINKAAQYLKVADILDDVISEIS